MRLSSTLDYKDWFIAYSPYVDTLHVYSNDLNKKSNEELVDKDFGKFFATFDLHSHELLLFEMKSASQDFGDIDNMDKEHIIKRVKEMIGHYGRTK